VLVNRLPIGQAAGLGGPTSVADTAGEAGAGLDGHVAAGPEQDQENKH
jgi:hypothetical protein